MPIMPQRREGRAAADQTTRAAVTAPPARPHRHPRRGGGQRVTLSTTAGCHHAGPRSRRLERGPPPSDQMAAPTAGLPRSTNIEDEQRVRAVEDRVLRRPMARVPGEERVSARRCHRGLPHGRASSSGLALSWWRGNDALSSPPRLQLRLDPALGMKRMRSASQHLRQIAGDDEAGRTRGHAAHIVDLVLAPTRPLVGSSRADARARGQQRASTLRGLPPLSVSGVAARPEP